MKITFGKYGLGDNYWCIENNEGILVITPEEAKELVKQIKKAGF